MARAYRILELEQKYGDLHKVIPEMVNKHGQNTTGERLGVSASTINLWLKHNGYRLRKQYVREESK